VKKTNQEIKNFKKIQEIFDRQDKKANENESSNLIQANQLQKVNSHYQESLRSLNGAHFRENKITSNLNLLCEKKRIRSITKVSIVVVYFVAFLVIALFSLNYFFSAQSFLRIKQGATIINTAGYRVLALTILWQSALAIYSRATGFRPYSTVVPENQILLLSYCNDLMNRDDSLQTSLQDIGNKDLIDIYFNKNIPVREPYANNTITSEFLDLFTANKILTNKYLYLARFQPPTNIALLNNSLNVLFTLNNTVNEMLIESESQLEKTFNIMNNVVDDNKNLLIYLLVLEILAEAFVGISLLLISKVIIGSYKKLFGALTNVRQISISKRIVELKSVYEGLSHNIESKELKTQIEASLEYLKTKRKNSIHIIENYKNNYQRSQNGNLKLKEFVIQTLRYLIRAQVLVVLVIFFFIVSYLLYSSAFSTLQTMTNRLSLVLKLSYSYNLILGNFYYLTLFHNQTDFLFKNGLPGLQEDKMLSNLTFANNDLLNAFSNEKGAIEDPTIELFFKSTVCPYLTTKTYCESVTKGYVLGLLSINNQVVEQHAFYYKLFKENPTLKNAGTVFSEYVIGAVPGMVVSKNAYQFLREYLMQQFILKADEEQKKSLIRFIFYIIGLSVVTLLIQIMSINKSRRSDIGIRKILKVVALNLIPENKNFGFYLKNEFKGELEEIKQFI